MGLVLVGISCGLAWAYLLLEIVPNIDQWRAALVKQASRTLGTPVRIGQIQGRTEGLWPVVTLQQIELLDAQGRVGLRLPSVSARLSPATLWPTSLWRQEVHIDRLVLHEPQLNIRRDALGTLHVAGLELTPTDRSPDTTHSALDWLLDQERVRIVGGRVVWTDELRQAPALELRDVDLSLRNRQRLTERVHDWTLQATPPSSFGGRMRLQAHLTQPYWNFHAQPRPQGASADGWRWLAWLGQPARAGDWNQWSGLVQLDLPHTDVQALKRHASLPFDIQGGHGSLQANLALKDGRARQMVLETDVQAVSVRLAPTLKPLAFARVTGQVSVRLDDTQAELSWQKLQFKTAEGLQWPASQARWVWQHAGVRAPTVAGTLPLLPDLAALETTAGLGGTLETDHVDLALLAQLADRLPLPPAWRNTLENLSPTGLGSDIKVSWTGPATAARGFALQGRFERLGWMPFEGRPGLSGANLSVRADEGGGTAQVSMAQGWVEFPGAFEEARIPVDALQAEVSWKAFAAAPPGGLPGLRVTVQKATFSNEDAQGQLQATWESGTTPETRFPGHLDLQGNLARALGARVWRYLPAAIHESARHYVRDAVRAGVGENVGFEVKGALAQFPFADARQGRFYIKVPVRDAVLDYVPGIAPAPAGPATTDALVAPGAPGAPVAPVVPYWPAFSNLQGTLVFDGASLRIESASALLGGLGSGRFVLRQVQGGISDLGSDQPVLHIRGEGEGPLNDLLKYVALSPINEWTDRVLNDARGTGQGNLDLALTIPLSATEKSKVTGKIVLLDKHQAALRLSADMPLLQGLRGQIGFTETGLQVNARARALGQELQVIGQSGPQSLPRFTATGVLSAEALRTQTESPPLARLAQHLSGQTPVQLTVALARVRPSAGTVTGSSTRPELTFSSTLQGLGLRLPAPFTKDPASAWPVKWTRRGDDSEGRKDLVQLDVTAPGLALRTDHRRSGPDGARQVTRGLVSLVQGSETSTAPALAMPTAGVVGRVQVQALDIDAWQTLLQDLSADDGGKAAVANTPGSHTGGGEGLRMDDFFPQNLQLKVGALTWQQRTIADLTATLAHPGGRQWKVQLDSAPVAGQVELRPDGDGVRVVARLKRLLVPAAEVARLQAQASQQFSTPEGSHAPRQPVPSLDIVVDQLDWRGLALGRLELQATNRVIRNPGSVPQSEWRLTTLNLSNADAQLKATGNWAPVGAQNEGGALPGASRDRAAFSFTLDLSNSGSLLGRLGQPQTLKGGNGKITGHVSWPGSPLSPDISQLRGDMQVALSEGQFLKVEPGVGRLLGVLSLQALPRRLLLDFRDVFQAGFAFDRIDGDVTLAQGLASTRNLRMRGVQAVVLMEGSADLRQETQNLRVFVVPEINAGTASLAYAAINPAIGLGTFVAQMLLRKTVVDAGTREFTVTGPWADPVVEKVVRTADSPPAPSPDDAPSAPGRPATASEAGPGALKDPRKPS